MGGYKLTLWFVSCNSMVGHLVLCVPTKLEVEEEDQKLTLVQCASNKSGRLRGNRYCGRLVTSLLYIYIDSAVRLDTATFV